MRFETKSVSIKNWIDSAQNRDFWGDFVNVALNLWVPKDIELVCNCNFVFYE